MEVNRAYNTSMIGKTAIYEIVSMIDLSFIIFEWFEKGACLFVAH